MKKALFTLILISTLLNLNVLAQNWEEIQKILPIADGSTENTYFGRRCSIDEDFAVVGEPGYNSWAGCVYVLWFDGNNWVTLARLTASDAEADDNFGYSVDISGDFVVVGAYNDDDNGANSGSAYIFKKPESGWEDMTQTAKITSSDGKAGYEFGRAVSISGNTIVVGEPENDRYYYGAAAYVFEKPADGWVDMTETAKLTASVEYFYDFGCSVSISGDCIVVGVNLYNGAAFVFEKPEGGWVDMTETAILNSPGFSSNYQFGKNVFISDDIIAVGAKGDDYNGNYTGSVYIYEKPVDGWVSTENGIKLTASDGARNDYFGGGISVSGDIIIISAVGDDDNGVNSGSAYIFTKPAGGWTRMNETLKVIASDGMEFDNFGSSVCISGNKIIVGADDVNHPNNGNHSGAVYAFVYKESENYNENICEGDDFIYELLSQEAGATFQWQQNTDGTWQSMNGETDDALLIENATIDMNGDMYRCLIYGTEEDTSEVATLNVNPIYSLTETITINSGEDYVFPDGSTQSNITSQIKYISNLKTDIGCDSIIETIINIKSSSEDLFSKSDISFRTDLIGSTLSFGDYDNDGDQDILYSGTYHPDTSILARILRNDGNSFSNQTIIQYEQYTESGFIDWEDIDNDEDLDIILSFENWMNSEYATQFYQNNNVDFSLLSGYEIELFTNGVWCDWGDYNNDGLVDLVISGSDLYINPVTSIYKNTGSGFVKVFEEKIENLKGSVDFGDYDNDGDLDLLLFGYGTGRAVGKIYENTGDDFVEAGNSFLPELQYGSCAWVDFNSDGYLDIFLTGRSYTEGEISRIYQNNGSGFEEKSFNGLAGMYFHDFDFGDYNNDGYLDIVGSGRKSDGERIFSVFGNELIDFVQTGMVFNDTISGDVEWQDYDQDGDLDFVAIGIITDDPYSENYYNDFLALYSNSITVKNNPALAPQNISSNISGTEVTLIWDKTSDTETPQDGLSYNIEVYKEDSKQKAKVFYTRIERMQYSDNGYTLKNLPEGTYYWKVQAFDTGLQGGEFSEEQSFDIGAGNENTHYEEASICDGETYTFGTQELTTAGEYTEIFTASDDTDSTVVLTLTVNPVYDITETVSVCNGSSYTFPDGTVETDITTQIEHTSNLQTIFGCDSVITTTVDVTQGDTYEVSEEVSICEGDDYTFPDGTTEYNISDTTVYISNLLSVQGCDSIVETTVNIKPLPQPAFSYVCDSVFVIFTNETMYGENYLWRFGDGEASFMDNPTHTYPELGKYEVRLKALNECGSVYLNDSITVEYLPTGIEDITAEKIKIYPNPANERIYIDYDQDVSVEFYNLVGLKVLETNECDIHISELNRGTYILIIRNEFGEIIRKAKIIKD